MHIGICEDNQAQRSLLEKYIKAWSKMRGEKLSLKSYDSGEAFLFSREDEPPFDLLILDIQMLEISGLDLAKKIRQEQDDVMIIFVTAIKEYVFEGYDVEALQYLLKPVNQEKLFESLDLALKKVHQVEPTIIVDQEKIKIPDVLYIEVQAHYIEVNLDDQVVKSKKSLKEMHVLLEKHDFMLTHRSYLVNIAKVSKIGKTFVIMDNRSKVPISRSKYKAFNQAFIKYHQERDIWI